MKACQSLEKFKKMILFYRKNIDAYTLKYHLNPKERALFIEKIEWIDISINIIAELLNRDTELSFIDIINIQNAIYVLDSIVNKGENKDNINLINSNYLFKTWIDNLKNEFI